MNDRVENVVQASNLLHDSDVRATLDAWRTQGADRIDPVAFATLDAMEKRAQALEGAARGVLDARIQTRLAAFAQQIEAHTDAQKPASDASANDAFASLIDAMSRETRDDAPTALLDYFRDVWQKVSADQQVQQSRDQVPKNAGPLNSSQLVHRALFLMRDLSPGYLRQFLAYADGLAWFEDLHAGITPPAAQAAQTGAAKKPRRTRARQ